MHLQSEVHSYFTSEFSLISSSSVVVETIVGDHEDICDIYPPCKQFGAGTWQILEGCHKYIICNLQSDGTYVQQNMECSGDLVYDEEHGDCVDSELSYLSISSMPL